MRLHLAKEQDLILQARGGDAKAYELLIEDYAPQLYRVVQRMVADPGEAEAIVQETFWRTWQSLSRFREDQPLFPYLVTIASNLVRDTWRKERWLLPDDVEDEAAQLPDDQVSLEQQLEEKELLQSLAEVILDLPAPYRTVIALRYDAGLSYEQIAQTLRLPLNTVRTHLRRAKEALRQKMEAKHG